MTHHTQDPEFTQYINSIRIEPVDSDEGKVLVGAQFKSTHHGRMIRIDIRWVSIQEAVLVAWGTEIPRHGDVTDVLVTRSKDDNAVTFEVLYGDGDSTSIKAS